MNVFGVALDDLAKIIGAAALVLYVLGLLVAQLYLLSLGISDFELIRTRFILTGGLALVPVMVVLVVAISLRSLFIVSMSYFQDKGVQTDRITMGVAFIWFLAILLIPTIVLTMNMVGIGFKAPITESLEPNLGPALVSVLALGSLPIAMETLVRGGNLEQLIHGKVTFFIPLALVTLAINIWCAFIYLDFVANSVFPTVPEQFGGARPREVELVFAAGQVKWAIDVGLITEEEAALSVPLYLLWETGDTLILRDPRSSDDSVFQLSRNAIEVLIIEPIELPTFRHESDTELQAPPPPTAVGTPSA